MFNYLWNFAKTLPSKIKWALAALAAIALQRLVDRALPPGTEGSEFESFRQWIGDVLNAIPTDYVGVAAGTAIFLYLWDERQVMTTRVVRSLRNVTKLSFPSRGVGLVLSFEPKHPWVHRIPNARTQPKNMAHSQHGPRVETDSLWFRVKVSPTPGLHVVRGVLPYLTGVEKLKDGIYAPTTYGASLQLRWADRIEGNFEKRDIHSSANELIDILSTDEEHNKIWIKWKERFLTNDKLFDEPGIYRLTVSELAREN